MPTLPVPAPSKYARAWRAARLTLLVALLLAVVRLVLVQGLVRTIRVSSGSMAEFLRGPHTAVVCGDCGMPFTFGNDHPPLFGPVVCPNCGFSGTHFNSQSLPGNRVLIDRGAFYARAPKRWEVVALHAPGEAKQLVTKRVVGLPGERLEIRRGEILINGEIWRKSLTQLREVAVPVYHDSFRPSGPGEQGQPLPARWQPVGESQGWRHAVEGFEFTPEAGEQAATLAPAWLAYQHWACTGEPSPRTRVGVIVDLDGYNQGLSRGLNEVGDLLVKFHLRPSANSILWVQFHEGTAAEVVVVFDFRYQTVRAAAATGVLQEVALPAGMCDRESLVEVAVCDEQVFVAVQGHPYLECGYKPASELQASPRPLRIGAELGALQLRELQVLRDIYYLCPDGTGRQWAREMPLGAGEFFLLGDNSPASDDSRNWPAGGAVSRSAMIGRVWKL